MFPASKPYHHGDLKQALLKEAERILEEEGIQALTLRAVSRAVGVSHTAPQNHFGDLTGLLSELAAGGYRRLGAVLSSAVQAAAPEPRLRLRAMGRAYIAFVRAHPGLFTLMFRSERLDSAWPALQDAIANLRQILREAVGAVTHVETPASPLDAVAQTTAVWALVHGYAMLMLEGRLKTAVAGLPGESAATLFEAVMNSLSLAGVD
jgi:AcrR family transcriptional regulator